MIRQVHGKMLREAIDLRDGFTVHAHIICDKNQSYYEYATLCVLIKLCCYYLLAPVRHVSKNIIFKCFMHDRPICSVGDQ